MTHELIGAVMRYDDGVYLHQTIVRGPAGLTRYVDLPDAVAAFKDGRADGEWRIHCHVPLFLSDLGEIGSTRADLVSTLGRASAKITLVASGGRDLHLGRSAGQFADRLESGRYRARDFILHEGTGRMSVAAAQMPSLSTLLRLGRISNVPTVWTNVLAGSIIAGGAAASGPRSR